MDLIRGDMVGVVVIAGAVCLVGWRMLSGLNRLQRDLAVLDAMLRLMAAQQRVVLPPPPASEQEPAGHLEGWEHFGVPTLPDPREVAPEVERP